MKRRITAEQVAFAGAVLLAALVRAWNLGSMPMQPGEAVVAVQSWSMFRGLPSTVEYGPAITYGNALIFSVFGANDASARLLPVLAGCVLVALCYYSRPYIGRHAAIASAFLLAISPTAVFFSRFVGSELIATTALLGSVVLFFRYLGGRGRAQLYGAAATLGLAVSASVTGLVGLVILLAFIGGVRLLRRFGGDRRLPALASGRESVDGGELQVGLGQDARAIRNAVFWFGVVVVLVATGVFSNLHGIQEGIITPIFSQTWPVAGILSYSRAYYVQILIIYETVVVVFAFVHVLYSDRPKGLFSWFLIWWALASLVFASAWPQKSPSLVIQPLVPTTLLAGEMVGGLLAWMESERPFVRLGVLAALTLPPLLLIAFSLSRFSLPAETIRWEVVLAPLFVLALAIAGFVLARGAAETTRLSYVCLLVFLLMIYVHAGSYLNFRGELSPTELFMPSVATEDVRNLATEVSDLIRIVGDDGARKGIFVDSSLRYPLAWYLRQLNGVEYASKPTGDPAITVAAEGSSTGPGQSARYLVRYTVLASWEPKQLDVGTIWRWLAYREPGEPVKYRVAEVSVR